jgi:signal transduction histidine kinase
MKLRSWQILALGFGSLVLLIVLFGLDALRRAQQSYQDVLAIYEHQAHTDQALRQIKSGLYTSGIVARDFLLDRSEISAPLYRQQLRDSRKLMNETQDKLAQSAELADQKLLDELGREMDSYWASMDPIFDWTPQQRLALSALFLRQQVLPRREAVLRMANEIERINQANLVTRRQVIENRVREYRRSGRKMLAGAILLAVVASLASIIRISRLENRAERQHQRTERAEQELRSLSQQLVRIQEEERKHISRELHDEVGQTLTALRVELGNLERVRFSADDTFREHMKEAKGLAEQTLRSVRSLAMGLRPSMLDDLGLGPALEWQAREFSRRTGIPVEVSREGELDDLPEAHRTCLYRAVQESLTNCARHAQAHQIRIAANSDHGRLSLIVQDDGRGMPAAILNKREAYGTLGLLGIEERVKELAGKLEVYSRPGKGTLLKITIPLPAAKTA